LTRVVGSNKKHALLNEVSSGGITMAEKEQANVTIRVRIGDNELEVTGPSDYVEKKITEFREQQKATSSVAPEKGHLHPPTQTPPKSTKGMSVAQFFKKVLPQTHADRFLTAGYYLEKIENMEKFTVAELSKIITSGAKKQLPQNPNDIVNGNIKKGLMMAAGDKDGKMAFVLTSDGEDAIEALLNA